MARCKVVVGPSLQIGHKKTSPWKEVAEMCILIHLGGNNPSMCMHDGIGSQSGSIRVQEDGRSWRQRTCNNRVERLLNWCRVSLSALIG